VIISDLGMPHEDGSWFVRQVRGLSSPVSGIPAVALTGFDGVRAEAAAARRPPSPISPSIGVDEEKSPARTNNGGAMASPFP
jgi:hypothetical protein